MTASARSRPRMSSAAATALSLYSSRPCRRLATWWRGIISRRGRHADLRAQLRFEPCERLLAVGAAPGGGYAVAASDRALYHRGDGAAWARLGWEQVVRVGWAPAGRWLVITRLDGVIPTRTVVPLRERGSMPEIAMERITHTRLGSWRIVLPGGPSLAVVARRRPATDELLWFVFCAGDSVDLSVGDQRAQVERAIAQLAAEAGLTQRPAAVLPLALPARRPAPPHPPSS